jgi:YhcN/YlaJ family sporulation lipoprotein
MMVCAIGFSLLLAGCQTSQKPTTPQPNPQTTQKTYMTSPDKSMTSTTAETRQIAMKAEKADGVRDATALVAGKSMYIGLALEADLGQDKADMTENSVLNNVKNMDPSYKIMVSSDIDTVTRIKRVAQGIAAGRPLTSFSNEIKDIGTRMTPKSK